MDTAELNHISDRLTAEQKKVLQTIGNYQDENPNNVGMPLKNLHNETGFGLVQKLIPILDILRKRSNKLVIVENDIGEEYFKGPSGGDDENFRDLVGRTFTARLSDEGRKFYKPEPTAKQEEQKHAENHLAKRFKFKTGEIRCDGVDTGIRKEDSREVLQNLINRPDEFIPFKELLSKQESEKEAKQPLRDAISDLKKKLKPFGIKIENRRGIAYKIIEVKHD